MSTSSRWSTSPARRWPSCWPADRLSIADGLKYASADRRCAGGRARRRDSASRHQASEHHDQRQRRHQGSRFRAREAGRVGWRRSGRRAAHDRQRRAPESPADRERNNPGHRGIHGSRTGRGKTGGHEIRCLFLRCRALRNDHGPPRVRRCDKDVDTRGDPDESAGTTEPRGPWAGARPREDDSPLSPQESRAALAIDGGPESGARGTEGRIGFAQHSRAPGIEASRKMETHVGCLGLRRSGSEPWCSPAGG